MWVRVRTMDCKQASLIDGLSKLTKIEDLRKLLETKFNAPAAQQRLIYGGKQLEDGHTLYDYDVKLNDLIQIIVRDFVPEPTIPQQKNSTSKNVNKENKPKESSSSASNKEKSVSNYFKIGDIIDAKDLTYGAWFEGKITDINADKPILQSRSSNDQPDEKNIEDDGLLYKVVFDDYEESENSLEVHLNCIRPRARKIIKFEDIKDGETVMVNYNIEEPKERGFWYDCRITGRKAGRKTKYLLGTILMGVNRTPLENCKIYTVDEVFKIEKNIAINDEPRNLNDDIQPRKKMPNCSECKDIPSKTCKTCSCHICGGKDAPEKQIMCDECDYPYHLWCLKPPLTEIPTEEEWYCPDCKVDETEVVRAGEKLKQSKKKAKMPSANSSSSRDWGKGMACVGRTKECTIVPSNHFGPIPGVEVGSMWKYRFQVSESGVHRPHVAGMHGREKDGLYSLVLSGGYEDDLDEGNEFKYTGSGGRDLSGNKRCAQQSCDQVLTRTNRALASNCNAPLNKNGAEAKDWKGGKPVRVVRSYKGRKHSKYCPEKGIRYDGIYKVVKYWPETGLAGFLVWRYLLRRDDPSPAPWTKAGKKRIEELGLTMQYPEGQSESSDEMSNEKKGKRKSEMEEANDSQPSNKKPKTAYVLSNEHKALIENDEINKKYWEECLEGVSDGYQAFLKKVEETFTCICCQDVVCTPITTVCFHNICKACLDRSFKAKVYNCPACRHELAKSCLNEINSSLQKALLSLFPGYNANR